MKPRKLLAPTPTPLSISIGYLIDATKAAIDLHDRSPAQQPGVRSALEASLVALASADDRIAAAWMQNFDKCG